MRVRVFTIGHGTRSAEELVECLREADVRTLVDVRRFPSSRRHPQHNQQALAETLAEALAEPAPCFMCAETPWWRCHRRLIAELLVARGHEVVHLVRPGERQRHRLYDESEVRGGRRNAEPGEEQFACLRVAGFRSYAARMGRAEWQQALVEALAEPAPCFMCAETPWWRCHRRLIAELLVARGHEVVHLVRPGERQRHRLYDESEVRDGRLYLCGRLVA